MIAFTADWLSISIDLLLVLFVVVCLLMSMIILMQRPKNEGLGAAFGTGATDQLFGARTTNVLQKGTVYLATLFFVLTLTLAVLIGKRNANRLTLVAEAPAPVAEVPAEEKPVSIADEKPLEPEAVTPPVQVPVEPAETPTPTPETAPEVAAPEAAADAAAPEVETPAEPAPEGEAKPTEEAPPAEEEKP